MLALVRNGRSLIDERLRFPGRGYRDAGQARAIEPGERPASFGCGRGGPSPPQAGWMRGLRWKLLFNRRDCDFIIYELIF